MVFLFSDTQIVEESFLEDINNMLNSGEGELPATGTLWHGNICCAGMVGPAACVYDDHHNKTKEPHCERSGAYAD